MLTLWHATTHAPFVIERMLGDRIVVRRYRMPEKVGSLWTPAADHRHARWAHDRTQTLWEVVMASTRAEECLGMAMPPGCIVQTLRRWPEDLHAVDEDGEHCFALSVAHDGSELGPPVRGVIIYDPGDHSHG